MSSVISTSAKQLNLLSWIPGSYLGGCEKYGISIAESAYKSGVSDVNLLVTSPSVLAEINRSTILPNNHLVPFQFDPETSRVNTLNLGMFLKAFKAKRYYSRVLVNYSPAVVHAVLPWHYHSYLFLEQCISLMIPTLVTFQLVAPDRRPPKAYVDLLNSGVSAGILTLSAISFNNRDLLADYYALPSHHIPVIPNRPPISMCSPSDTRPRLRQVFMRDNNIATNSILILTCASLVYQKGVDTLLHAAKLALNFNSNLVFCIAGDGPLRIELQMLAESLKISDSVRFLGIRSDVNDLLALSDYFFFPTRYEGESFAILEAACAGLPIIASKASGIPETLQDMSDAYLFDVDNVSQAASSLLRAVANRDEALSFAQNASRRVFMYTHNDMLQDTLSLIIRVANNTNPFDA